MKIRLALLPAALLVALTAIGNAQIGAGNGAAIALAQRSPAVQTAYNYLIDRFGRVYRIVDDESRANHAGH